MGTKSNPGDIIKGISETSPKVHFPSPLQKYTKMVGREDLKYLQN